MTAHVIGGTGYIGRAVVRRLFVGGHEPVGLVRELETEADDPTPAMNLCITHQGKDQP